MCKCIILWLKTDERIIFINLIFSVFSILEKRYCLHYSGVRCMVYGVALLGPRGLADLARLWLNR